MRKQALEEQSSPLALLMDLDGLEQQFLVESAEPDQGLEWIRLTPKAKDAAFQECRLGFDGVELRKMVLIDSLDQRSEVTFSEWKRNPEFPQETFRFVPEPGVDVVGKLIDAPLVFPLQD